MPIASVHRTRPHGAGIDVPSTLADAGIVGLWRYDILANLVFSDHAMAIMYGVDPYLAARGVSPAAFRAAIHPSDLPAALHALQTAIADGVPYNVRYGVIRDGGALTLIETHGRPLVENGVTVMITGANFDVTHGPGQSDRGSGMGVSKPAALSRRNMRLVMPPGVTGPQLRTARNMLNLSVATLSEESGASCAAINQLERSDDVGEGASGVAGRIKAALQARGVDFFLHVEGDGGVRRRR